MITATLDKSRRRIPFIILSFLLIWGGAGGPVRAGESGHSLEITAEEDRSKEDVSQESEGKETVLEEVEVTSEKIETGQVDLTVSPGFFTVIDRSQFQGRMENVADVIEKEAGVQVRQQGGLGGFSTVSLRGSSSDQVMIYLDGILLNDGSGGGVNLGNISLSDVESLEIYRGTTPANFSKASIGGVVNIKTLKVQEGLNASASAAYGSFNTRQASAYLNHNLGRFDYLISADYSASDNDFEIFNDNGTQFNKDDDRYEDRNNAQYDKANVLVKAGYDLGGGFRLDGMNQFFYKDQGLSSWNNSTKTDASLTTKRNISTLRLSKDNLTSLHLNAALRLDYLWQEEEYDDRHDGIGLGRQLNIYNTDRYGANLFVEWPTRYHTAAVSADIRYEDYLPVDKLGVDTPPSSDRTSISAALQDSLVLLDERLTITPALRYTRLKDHLKSAVSSWGSVLEGRKRQEQYVNPQIGLKFQALDWLALKSNFSQYVREPNFYELFGDRGFLAANKDLEAESGINFDVGLEVSLTPKVFCLDRLFARAAYFRSDVDDIIIRVYDSYGVGTSKNIAHADIQGVELQLNVDFLEYFRFSGNATFQEAINHGDVKAFEGKELPGRFNQSYFCRLEFLWEGLKVYGEYQAQKGMYYDTANLLPAEDKNVFNVGLSYKLWGATVDFEVRNVGDDQYEDFNGYPSAGRSFWLSLSYDY